MSNNYKILFNKKSNRLLIEELKKLENIWYNWVYVSSFDEYDLDNFGKIIEKIRNNTIEFPKEIKIVMDLIDAIILTIINRNDYFKEEEDYEDKIIINEELKICSNLKSIIYSSIQ